MRKLFFIPLIALAAVATVALASGPGTAPAAAATTCQERFDLLEADTQSVDITAANIDKVNKERAGLLKLIEDAEALAAVGKTSDAIKKLLDYEVKVDQLEAAGRISAESAAQLSTDAEATIACLQSSSV
jgi:hypothetical protein